MVFRNRNIDLHGQFTNSLQSTIGANIQIRPEILEGLIEVAPHDNFSSYLGFIHFNHHHIDKAITALSKIKIKMVLVGGF